MLPVDNMREVKLRRYRVSLKRPRDSEWGQRCRNSIQEPRQQVMIKTSSPAHTEDFPRGRYGQEHGATLRKHKDTEEEGETFDLYLFFPGNLESSSLFFKETKTDFHSAFFEETRQKYTSDFVVNFS